MIRTGAKTKSGSKELYLKGKNALYLWSFISINVAVFLCLLISKTLTETSIDHFWHRVTMRNGLFAVAIPILAIVFSGVLGDQGKARLVFWRWKNPLPGCRVFSELLKTDPRLDLPVLRSKLGELPRGAHAQNALWFSIYSRHSAAPRISESHKIYLLTRDMAVVAAAFALLLPIAAGIGTADFRISFVYGLALIGQYVLISNAARNYGNRFVLNVLAEESCS